ncbi:MAG: sporulation protein YabP [Clostridium sp.]|uniref:sporulation protein YabP n=1 Tax=Clostridium sp. TaxID=1506 RepID=UPI003049DE4E
MEQNKDITLENKKSFFTLENRKKMTLDGVLEIISFNEDQIIIVTVLGDMDIRGEELKMTKLDVQNGDVVITGKISYVAYTSEEKRPKKQNGIIARIFR